MSFWFLTFLLALHRFASAFLLKQDGEKVKVLVFGDSWGALGPSWHAVDDTLKWHGVDAIVRSTAVSGTRACQWSLIPSNLAMAANAMFPGGGPDFVWLSVGGNDLLDHDYLKCSRLARNYGEAVACVHTVTLRMNGCTAVLLDQLYEKYPKTKVFQCGYDFQCGEGSCLPLARFPFCENSITCANAIGVKWQNFLLTPMAFRYSMRPGWYNPINIDGTVQFAAAMPNASVGFPILEWGSPCFFMTACVHPTRGSAAAIAIGDAFWDLFFSKHVKPNMKPVPRPTIVPYMSISMPAIQRDEGDTEVNDTYCNWDWVPSIMDMKPAPCNRTSDS